MWPIVNLQVSNDVNPKILVEMDAHISLNLVNDGFFLRSQISLNSLHVSET